MTSKAALKKSKSKGEGCDTNIYRQIRLSDPIVGSNSFLTAYIFY